MSRGNGSGRRSLIELRDVYKSYDTGAGEITVLHDIHLQVRPGEFVSVVGQAIVQIPLDFAYSASGALMWLLIVMILSALASLWPALRATHVSVRESLAYE
jgi:ABC-type lipoprotein release transport system permease subunit